MRVKLSPLEQAPPRELMDFWCRECRLDLYQVGVKNVSGEKGTYESRCRKCGGVLRRYITDKFLDPFWKESRLIQNMRAEYARDLIQPDDPRFRLIYGLTEQEKKAEKEAEAREESDWAKKREVSKSFIAL